MNNKKIDVVEIMPGEFALRRSQNYGGYEYKDLSSGSHSWLSAEENVMNYCTTKNFKKIKKMYQLYSAFNGENVVDMNAPVFDKDSDIKGDQSLADIMKPIPPKGRTISEDLKLGFGNFFKCNVWKVKK